MAKDTGLDFEQLATAFQHQNFEPIYFLFGEETFLIDELQEMLIENALEPGQRDFNFDQVYGAEAEADDVLALCSGYPVMAERRVVVVRDFDQLDGNRKFKEYAENPNPQAVVFLACTKKPNLAAHPYRALKENAEWSWFKTLYDNEVPGWINQRASSMGLDIDPQAVQMLAEYIGADLRGLASELDKLVTFIAPRERITAEDVVAASGQTREHNVFELQKSIGKGQLDEALRIADQMMLQASNPRSEALMIVAVLNSYFTKLWKMPPDAGRKSKNQLAGIIGVSPYFVQEYVASARRFGAQDIAEAFSALLAADFELKGGSERSARLIVTLLLRQIVPSHTRRQRAAG